MFPYQLFGGCLIRDTLACFLFQCISVLPIYLCMYLCISQLLQKSLQEIMQVVILMMTLNLILEKFYKKIRIQYFQLCNDQHIYWLLPLFNIADASNHSLDFAKNATETIAFNNAVFQNKCTPVINYPAVVFRKNVNLYWSHFH